ncbi:MAG: hypothetical protein ABW001_15240 [Mycobacterium sp.]
MNATNVLDIIDVAEELIAFEEMLAQEELLEMQVAAYSRVA